MTVPKRKRGNNVDNASASLNKVGPKTKNKTTGPKKTKKMIKMEVEQLQLSNSDEKMLGALRNLESPTKKQKKKEN
jgi:hypothetical protein